MKNSMNYHGDKKSYQTKALSSGFITKRIYESQQIMISSAVYDTVSITNIIPGGI